MLPYKVFATSLIIFIICLIITNNSTPNDVPAFIAFLIVLASASSLLSLIISIFWIIWS